MLYLIGGAPRTGKSKLSDRLTRNKGIPYIPTDAVHNMIARAAPELGHDRSISTMHSARQFEKFLLKLASDVGGAWENFAVEGEVILPRHVPRLQKRLGAENVRACFLGWSEVDPEKIIRYQGKNVWFGVAPEEEQERCIKIFLKHSRYLERECERHNVPYVDMAAGSYRTQQTLAYQLLTE